MKLRRDGTRDGPRSLTRQIRLEEGAQINHDFLLAGALTLSKEDTIAVEAMIARLRSLVEQTSALSPDENLPFDFDPLQESLTWFLDLIGNHTSNENILKWFESTKRKQLTIRIGF